MSKALLAAGHSAGSLRQHSLRRLACVLVLVGWAVGLKWLWLGLRRLVSLPLAPVFPWQAPCCRRVCGGAVPWLVTSALCITLWQ